MERRMLNLTDVLSQMKRDLNITDIPSHAVRLTCALCEEGVVKFVYFPHVSHYCAKCGRKVHLEELPSGIIYVWGEEILCQQEPEERIITSYECVTAVV
jgi:hypothetical protein